MIEEEEFDVAVDAPNDLAFARLERRFRLAYENKIKDLEDNNNWSHYTLEYMNHTIAAAEACELSILSDFNVAFIKSSDIGTEYEIFRKIVDRFIVKTQILHARNRSNYTVALDSKEKSHIHAYVDEIKKIIQNANISIDKKEKLTDKINSFLKELDRDRTSIQRFTDMMLTISVATADSIEELEPAWKWVRLIAGMLGVSQEEQKAKLPPPPKRIEGPKSKRDSAKDDEIPF